MNRASTDSRYSCITIPVLPTWSVLSRCALHIPSFYNLMWLWQQAAVALLLIGLWARTLTLLPPEWCSTQAMSLLLTSTPSLLYTLWSLYTSPHLFVNVLMTGSVSVFCENLLCYIMAKISFN